MNHDGLTALHQCCIDGSLDMVTLLLQYGANINIKDRDLWTPLHAAATCAHFKIVILLVESGANITAINGDGYMPHDIAEGEVTQQYLENELARLGLTEDKIDELRQAPQVNMLDDINHILSTNGDLNQPLDQGGTFLHTAIANGFNDIVSLLLKNGASVTARDEDGWEPIHVAAYWGNEQAIEKLVREDDTDINSLTDNGETPCELCEDPDLRLAIIQLLNNISLKYGSVKPYTTSELRRPFEMKTYFNETDNGINSNFNEQNDKIIDTVNIRFKEQSEFFNTSIMNKEENQEKKVSAGKDDQNEPLDINLEESLPCPLLNLEASELSERRNSVKEAKHLAPLKRANSLERHHSHNTTIRNKNETTLGGASNLQNLTTTMNTAKQLPIIAMDDDDDDDDNDGSSDLSLQNNSINSNRYIAPYLDIQSHKEKGIPTVTKQNTKRRAPMPSLVLSQEMSEPDNYLTQESVTSKDLKQYSKPQASLHSSEIGYSDKKETEQHSKARTSLPSSELGYSNTQGAMTIDLSEHSKPERSSPSSELDNFSPQDFGTSRDVKQQSNQTISSLSSALADYSTPESVTMTELKQHSKPNALSSSSEMSKSSTQDLGTMREMEQSSKPRVPSSSSETGHSNTEVSLAMKDLNLQSKPRASSAEMIYSSSQESTRNWNTQSKSSSDTKYYYSENNEKNNNHGLRRKSPSNQLTLLDLKKQRQEARQSQMFNLQDNERTGMTNSTFYDFSDPYVPPPSPTMIRYRFKMTNEESHNQNFIKEKKCIIM